MDGTVAYSKIITIDFYKNSSGSLKATIHNSTLYIHDVPKSFENGSATLQLYNTVGELLYSTQILIPSTETAIIHQLPMLSFSDKVILVLKNTRDRISTNLQ
ncbi:MAG: hypothetical protein ACKVOW_21220 [Chitinophagaceae bacterium]